MKKYSILLLLCLLCTCCDDSVYRTFTNTEEMIEEGKSMSKPLLLCITGDKNQLVDNKILQDNFLCYMTDDVMNTDIGKIVRPFSLPIYLIFDGDSIVSCLSQEELERAMAEGALDSHFYSSHTGSNGRKKKLTYWNSMLKLHRSTDWILWLNRKMNFTGNIYWPIFIKPRM